MKIFTLNLLLWTFCTSLICNAQTKNESTISRFSLLNREIDNDCIDSLFFQLDRSKLSVYHKRIDTVYNRIEILIDSINYDIVIMDYLNGNPIVKSIKNNLTNITYWNQYQENGKLKCQGYTSGYLLEIGKWEIYSQTGRFDSIADYEKDRKLAFCKILEIAVNLGIQHDDLDYKYNTDVGSWKIKNWTKAKEYIINGNNEVTINDLKN